MENPPEGQSDEFCELGGLKAKRLRRSDEDFVREVLSKPEDAIFSVTAFKDGKIVDKIFLNKYGYLRHFGFDVEGPEEAARE